MIDAIVSFFSQLKPAEVAGLALSLFALVVSAYTYWKSFGKPFDGRAYSVSRIILTWLVEDNFAEDNFAEDNLAEDNLAEDNLAEDNGDERQGERNYSPGIVTEVEYINLGATLGKIDDVMLEWCNNHTGEVVPFRAFMLSSDIDLLPERGGANNPHPNYSQFSTVWLGGGAYKMQQVFFTPTVSTFSLAEKFVNPLEAPTEFKIKLLYFSVNNFTFGRGRIIIMWRHFWASIFHTAEKRVQIEWIPSPISYNFRISSEDLIDWQNKKTVFLEALEVEEGKDRYFGQR